MLSIRNIEDFMDRIGFYDSNFSVSKKDSFGDILCVFDPDSKYEDVKRALENSRPMRNKVVNSGVKYSEIHDTIYVDGNKVSVSILCEEGDNGFGLSVKMMVKSIDYMINGQVKSFLGFESLKSYISRNLVQ